MLVIRKQQLEVFQAAAEAGYVTRLADYLRRKHSQAVVRWPSGSGTVGTLPGPFLHKLARTAIARARSHGIQLESNIGAFAVLMFVVAPNFDECPAIKRVLSDENVAADVRVNRLWVQTSPRDWEEARKGYDPTRWEMKEIANA